MAIFNSKLLNYQRVATKQKNQKIVKLGKHSQTLALIHQHDPCYNGSKLELYTVFRHTLYTIIEAVKTIMQSIRRDLSLPIRYIYTHYFLTTKNICLPIRYIIENN